MTTICTDGKSMAADRMVSGDGLSHGSIRKIVQLGDGTVIGVAGSVFQINSFAEWLASGQTEKFDAHGEMEALVLSPDGVVRCYDAHGRGIITDSMQATGTGAAIAYGAMEAGATPAEAAEIACRRDNSSGNGVDSYSIEGTAS